MSITKKTLKRPDPVTGRKVAYLVRVEGKRDPLTGRRRQLSRQVATMAQAKQLESEWTAEIARGSALLPNKTTVAELMTAWMETKRGEITAQSLKDYEIIVRKHIIPALGSIRIQELTPARVQAQYDSWRDAGMSSRMIKGCHMRLSQALKQAVRFGLVPSNVCESVTPPRLSVSHPATWSMQEAAQFLKTSVFDGLHPLWHLLLLEGMRRGEALGLRWRDINFEQGTAHIVQTVAPDKSNRGRPIILERTKTRAGKRTVRLTGRTLLALKEHRIAQTKRRLASAEWQDNDLIVCTAKGTPVNPNNVSRSFTALLRQTGMPRIRVHDLRHTAATLLVMSGVNAKVVSERLGHATIGITLDLYSHVLPDMQQSAAEAMDRLIDGTSVTA